MPENCGEKLIISSDFGYVSNILTLPSIICADKRIGGCKISSQYFSKMLPTPRYRTYRPIPSLNYFIFDFQSHKEGYEEYISIGAFFKVSILQKMLHAMKLVSSHAVH